MYFMDGLQNHMETGSEITNSFAVKVIDYLLDQAVDDKYRMFIKKERS